MIEFARLYEELADCSLAPWVPEIKQQITRVVENSHGDLLRWQGILNQLPAATASTIDLNQDRPLIGLPTDLDDDSRSLLRSQLLLLHPWRKGPFELFGVHVDSEWRCDIKWSRLAHRIDSLQDKLVLDVGGGNGYYALRMAGAGAQMVLSIDPGWLFVIQFAALAKYLGQTSAHVAPLAMEDLPKAMAVFDTVFSMGLLYHRRSPVSHLADLFATLKPGGQLVLETLVIESTTARVLVPEGRYAKMRNVWFIPSTGVLQSWLGKTGFVDIDLIDESITSTSEQRKTDWMHFESLSDYLDPGSSTTTIEGHPAPRRAVITARKPA